MEFSLMSYKEINEFIHSTDINTEYDKEIVNSLIFDTRKNVRDLGIRIAKNIEKLEKEKNRVKNLYSFDKNLGNYSLIAGVDEVGRGPLAGPIVAAAVILDYNVLDDKDLILYINDSKKLSAAKRTELSDIIKKKAISYSIGIIDNEHIDSRGISWCNNEIFRNAVKGLKYRPDLVISDGYAIRNLDIENKFFIKGDAKSAGIACASIVAKVFRDELMQEYAIKYPGYGFERNMGYGTEEHINAIRNQGICKIHRECFLRNII